MNNSAREIRNLIKAQRRTLTASERNVAALLIANQLDKINAFRRALRIAIYLPVAGEVDCRFFLNSEKMRKKRIFLPVLTKSHLIFAPLKTGAEMQKNRFGILEPVYKQNATAMPGDLDIVITPLVAFDKNCNRIGMGGGYYDKSFAFRKHRRRWRHPLLIGVAYDFQRVESIQPQSWDVPLDLVITEQQIYGSY